MDLSKLSREEKDSQLLCKRPDNFYTVAKAQISDREAEARNLSGVELDLLKEAILADKRDLKNINDLRIKKLIKAAVSDAYRDEPKHRSDPMLLDEKEFYDSLVAGIKHLRV